MSEGMFFRSSRRCSIKSFSSCSRSFLSMVLSYHKKRAPGNVFFKREIAPPLIVGGKKTRCSENPFRTPSDCRKTSFFDKMIDCQERLRDGKRLELGMRRVLPVRKQSQSKAFAGYQPLSTVSRCSENSFRAPFFTEKSA